MKNHGELSNFLAFGIFHYLSVVLYYFFLRLRGLTISLPLDFL